MFNFLEASKCVRNFHFGANQAANLVARCQ